MKGRPKPPQAASSVMLPPSPEPWALEVLGVHALRVIDAHGHDVARLGDVRTPGHRGNGALIVAAPPIVRTALRFVAAWRALDAVDTSTIAQLPAGHAALAEFDAARDEMFAACGALMKDRP